MTLSPLDDIILAADSEKCAVYFDSMTEPQRKALSARALQWASAINGYICRGKQNYVLFDKPMAKDIEFYQNIQSHKVVFPKEFTETSFPAARMAVLATSVFPELKKANILGLPEPDLAARILKARKPAWLDKWCAYILKEFPATHWLALYELEKSGTCVIERSAAYWMSMLCSLSHAQGMYENILKQDEHVRKELWEMLADPGVARMLAEPEQISHEIFRRRWNSGHNIFAHNQIGSRKGTEVWRASLVKLVSEGLIDSDRLIEYSFMALAGAAEKESKKSIYLNSTADYAVKLNQDLTKDHIASYAGQFASLLGATHKDVSTYASTVLADMPEGSLCVAEICSGIVPAFLNKSKEPADAALKLLGRVAKENPSKRSEYGPAILAALGHSSKDIHKKALALIESTNMLEDQNLLDEFRQRMDMLAGMERNNAATLAAKYQSSESTASDTVMPAHIKIASPDELYARASALDKDLRALAGVDHAIEASKNKSRLDTPVMLDSLDFPRLNPNAAVKQIANLDDLIYTFMKVWSGNSGAMELEAMLDGVSRLCNERPPDFQQKTDVIRQKAQKATEEYSMFGWNRSLAHLAFCWLGVSTTNSGPTPGSEAGSFFSRRCLALSKRAASRQSAPLLAAPTHAGGWIDPEVLVKRVLEYFWIKIEPDRVDFIQALLRLAPDNREAALEAAAQAKGEIGEALRYALGGGNITRVQTPEYWVAAFRARDPKGTSDELLKLMPKCGPDGAEAAVYGLDMEPVLHFAQDRYASISGGLPNFLPVTSRDPNFPGTEAKGTRQTMVGHLANVANRTSYAFFPTVLLHDNSNTWFAGNNTNIWLHNRESLLAHGAKRMLQNIESIGSYWHGDVELLFDPDVCMAENGRYFICFAMSSKNNDLSRLAVDALIAAVGECRIGGTAFGEAMAVVLPTGVITTLRWTRGLRDMSRTSPLHAHFTWQAVGAVIEKSSITPTQQIPFLELLMELQLEHRFKADNTLTQALSGITGGGKGAKLAKTILAFAGEDSAELQASLQDLESRINRAERWQNWIRAGRKEAVV